MTIRKEKRNAIYLDTYAWILYKMEKKGQGKVLYKKGDEIWRRIDNDINEHYRIIFNIRVNKKIRYCFLFVVLNVFCIAFAGSKEE